MAKSIDYETVNELLDYNPDTGVLTWKPRPLEMFKNEGVYKRFNNLLAGQTAGTNDKPRAGTYLRRTIGIFGKQYKAHRICWLLHYKKEPVNMIDHINGDALDNRIENLRDITNAENKRNGTRFSNNKTGFAGVHYNTKTGVYRSGIGVDSAWTWLGTYHTLDEAIAARKEAELKHGYHENHGKDKMDVSST
jgi:hypothetical protein